MIPAEAVEAAARALFADAAQDDDSLNWTNHQFEYRRQVAIALEAALPHMHAYLLSAVTEIHAEVSDGEGSYYSYCAHDGDGYPCETVRATIAAGAAKIGN